jgi:hypothetical protein
MPYTVFFREVRPEKRCRNIENVYLKTFKSITYHHAPTLFKIFS